MALSVVTPEVCHQDGGSFGEPSASVASSTLPAIEHACEQRGEHRLKKQRPRVEMLLDRRLETERSSDPGDPRMSNAVPIGDATRQHLQSQHACGGSVA